MKEKLNKIEQKKITVVEIQFPDGQVELIEEKTLDLIPWLRYFEGGQMLFQFKATLDFK